jgi:hypothetical protein
MIPPKNLKIDTVWLSSWSRERDDVKGVHWPFFHTIYGVDDTTVYAGKAPLGLISIPETCRYTPVWVIRDTGKYRMIPGNMLFGKDTLSDSAEKTELPLDGLWEPVILENLQKLENFKFREQPQISQPRTSTLKRYVEVPAKKNAEKMDFSLHFSGISFFLLTLISIYWVIGSAEKWRSLFRDLRCISIKK